jgi:glycosyltransferase involved in cell wall biosynthesis
MSKTPTVSVVMPVYNAEKYLSEAVESILTQTFSDFEFIIINDGSTDRSESILQEFQGQDKRIRLVSRSNTGIVATRNEGLELANGPYIAIMDADDIALPERLAKQVAFLEEHSNYVAVGSLSLMIDPDGLPVRLANKLTNHEEIDDAHMAGISAEIPHSGAMIRHDALQTIGGYRKEMQHAEDFDLWLRLAEIGRLGNLPDLLLKYRLHPKSDGHTRRAEQLRALAAALLDAYRRRGLVPPMMPNAEDEQQHSVDDPHRRWAWWSLGDGYVATARKHALLVLKSNPISMESWKLLACAVRGW